jgi:hypothetical protein
MARSGVIAWRPFALNSGSVDFIRSERPSLSATVGVGQKARCGEGSDVVVNRDIWPVLCEHPSAIGIDLAEGCGAHAGALEAETEATNSAE